MMLRRSHHNERGQSLVIVLSLITILFLLGSSLAVHASVALRATRTTAGEGNDLYAADAATELGIWWQRNGMAGNPPAQTINGVTTSTTITSVGGGGGSCPPDVKPIWMTGLESGLTPMGNIPVQQITESSTPLINWAFGGGDVTMVNSPVRTGSYALRIHPNAYPGTGAYRDVDKNIGNYIASTLVIRFSVRLAAVPTGDADIAAFGFNGGKELDVFYRASTGKWAMTFSASLVHSFTGTIVEGPTVSAGQWYNFDLRLVAANPRTAEWQVDGTAYPTASSSEAATPGIMLLYFGHTNGDNADITMYFDDIMASGTSADYPLGDVKIEPLLPNGMGTHNTPANYQNNDSTALNATSYQRVDEIPQTATTDYIKQVTAGGASYTELTFQDTTQTCIRGASLVFAMHSASTSANNIAVNSVTNGFNYTIMSGDPSETTLLYQQGMVTQNAGVPGTGPWTQAIINGIVARWGFSTDVSPNPYLDGMLLENGYRPIVASPATITIVGTGGGSTVSTSYTDAGAGVPTLSTWTTTK